MIVGAIFGQRVIVSGCEPELPDHLDARWSRLCDRYASKHPQLQDPGIYFFFTEEGKWPILVTHIK